MYDSALLPELDESPIPLGQIAGTRRDFPAADISYEVLIAAPDLLAGLERCAAAFARAGLALQSLRCHPQGLISCRLADPGSAELHLLACDLSGPVARVESWTTIIAAT